VSESVFNLLWLINRETFRSVPDCIRIHAGCGEHGGKRFIVVGDKGVGKTTFMVSLLLNGSRAVGDELVLVREGRATPFPRRFHIKQESTKLLPGIKHLFDALPFNMTTYNHKMFSFSPQDAGFEWKIDEGDVRAVFYLMPNHGGESRLEPCLKYEMVRNIMPMSFLSETDDHKKIDQLCSLVDKAECHVLHIGDLPGAISALQEKMAVI